MLGAGRVQDAGEMLANHPPATSPAPRPGPRDPPRDCARARDRDRAVLAGQKCQSDQRSGVG
jgi:hypothetical protein